MKKLIATGVLISLAQMANAQPVPPIEDGLHVNGEVLLTYGNTHYGSSDALAAAKLNFTGATDIGSARATVRGEVNLRSDIDSLPSDMDDMLNIEAALETGIGTFGYSTYHRCAGVGFPWTDGDVGNLGSANIHPWVPPTFRCAGGLSVYIPEGGLAADDHFFYRHNVGNLSINAWYDPDLSYDGTGRKGVATVDGEDAPTFEAELAYMMGKTRLMVGANDMGDKKASIMTPVGDTGLNLGYEYNQLNGAVQFDGHILTAMYFPKTPSALRMIRADVWHVENALGATFDNWLIDARFGKGDWELGVAYEGQGNFAVEGAYKIRDNMSIVAGFDSGFDTGDGWSATSGPPTSVAGRDASYEIGIKMTF